MKNIFNFIQEKLIINKNSKAKEITIQDKIHKAVQLGYKKGLQIIFRNRKTNAGDFCFFIYDKRKKSSYLVGYDGDWNAKEDSNTSFDNCYQATLDYIEQYKN